MPLENAPYVGNLNPANPTSGDDMGQGDDQIRLIKQAVVATFPNLTAQVAATAAQINAAAAFNPATKQDALGFTPFNFGANTPWHSGNFTPSTKQDAATAINTSNIASQSVSYAASAGSAGSAGSVSGGSSNGYGTRTVSTGTPSGGSDGDLWYQV